MATSYQLLFNEPTWWVIFLPSNAICQLVVGFQPAIENVGTYLYNMISAYIIFPMSYRSMQIRNGALWSWGALHVYEGRVIPPASTVSIELNPREPYTYHRRRSPIRVLLFIRYNDKKLSTHIIYKDADLPGELQCSTYLNF